MPNAQANIIVTAKNAATQEFNAIFSQVNAQMGKSTSTAKVLEVSYHRLAQSLRASADAARTSGSMTGSQIAQLEKMAQGADNAAKALDNTGKSSDQFKVNIVDLAAKLYIIQVATRNVIQALQGMYEFGKLGATVEQTTISFANMTESVGSNAQLLDRLRTAARGTASDLDLMKAAQTALIGLTPEVGSQFAQALPHILEIARAANIANPALGDTAFLFESLTTGLKRLSPRLIDNTGLQLKLGKAEEDYAKSVHKTVQELTGEEKQLALLNATMEAGDRLIQQIGGDTSSATDAYTKLSATFENTKNQIANDLNPTLQAAAEWLTQYIEGIQFLVKFLEGKNIVTDALSKSAEDLAKTNISQEDYTKILIDQAQGYRLLVDDVGRLYRTVGEHGIQIIDNQYLLTEAERDELKYGDMRVESIQQYRQGLDGVVDKTEEQLQKEREWTNIKEKTLDDLFLKELDANEKLLDARAKLAQKSIEIDTDYQDKLTEIHDRAEQDRIDIAERAGQERLDIADRYNSRIADIDKSISELRAEYENKNPFLSDTTQQELTDVEQSAKNLQNTIKMLRREQRTAPTDAREQLISDYEVRLQEIQDHLAEIRDRAREEERKARIAARIQELQEEKAALEKKRDQELDILNTQLQQKLSISISKEKELTDTTTAEYTRRRIAINDEMNKIAEEADKKMKEEVVDAMLALVPAGSTAAQALMEMKWKMHGATDEMIQDFMRTKAAIDGQDGLVGGINRFAIEGFGTFFGMQGAIAGLNGQLMFTKFLMDQMGFGRVSDVGNYAGGNMNRRQHGGPISANRPYIVGEAGPELFIPHGGGNIVSNDKIGGGATVNISINATAFQGSQADAIRFGNWVAPIVLQYMDRFGGNSGAVGVRRK